jgi:hypothetical protein
MARYAAQTEVSSDRSRSEIERTLRRYGATAFAYGWEGNRAQIGFKLADRQINLCGGTAAMAELTARFGWGDDAVTLLRQYRRAYAVAVGEVPGE